MYNCIYLGYHIDSLANELNYTVGDNHPVLWDGIGVQRLFFYKKMDHIMIDKIRG